MRRHFGSKGLVAAMEEEANLPVEGNAEELEVAQTDAAATDAVAEVSESSAEGDQQEDAMTEATDTADVLDNVADTLGKAAENGGIDKVAAEALNTCLEHIYSRVGLQGRPMPALESFGGVSSRVGATKIAMEGIKDKIKEIWKAIVAAIKRAIEWVVGHFNKVFGAAEKMQKRAKALKSKAEGIDGKQEGKIEDGSLFKSLYVGDSVKDVPAKMAKVQEIVKKVLNTDAGYTVRVGDSVVDGIEDMSKSEAVLVPAVMAKPIEGNELGEAGEGMAWERSEELPGGMAYVVRGPDAPKKGKDALAVFGKLKAGISAFKINTKTPEKTDVPSIDKSAVEKVCEVVDAIGAEIQSFRATNKKLQDLLKKAQTAADKASKSADDEQDADKKAYFQAVRSAAGNLPAFIVGPYKSVADYGLRTGNAALNLCDKSLALYKSK